MALHLARDEVPVIRLPNRGVFIAGKHRSHRGSYTPLERGDLLEPGLPAKNDDAVCLKHRIFCGTGFSREGGISGDK